MPLPTTPTPTPPPIPRPHHGAVGASVYSGWSPKMGRHVHFDNRLELHHWLLVEGDSEVEQLCEQYPVVQLVDECYVFDMWIRWRDGQEECRNVVPSWKFADARGFIPEPPGWSMLRAWGQRQGYRCRYVTEQELALHTVRIHNWLRMLPFVKRAIESPSVWLEEAVLYHLRGLPDTTLHQLIRSLPSADGTSVTAAVAKLLHQGKLAADLDGCRFGLNLLVRLPP
ncbi:MAG TPA: hypothetical protein VFK21_01960 [Gammaproteobacteria bacterium]|nr:hypothetical protein [Gammaproteobacteria bacterium]